MFKCCYRGAALGCEQDSYEQPENEEDEYEETFFPLCYWHRKVKNGLALSDEVWISSDELE